jgi:hypothetical protein
LDSIALSSPASSAPSLPDFPELVVSPLQGLKALEGDV